MDPTMSVVFEDDKDDQTVLNSVINTIPDDQDMSEAIEEQYDQLNLA